MFDVSDIVTVCRRSIAAAIVASIALVIASASAHAQVVIMLVNGDPITAFDIEQRTRFLQLASGKMPPRQEVLDELIDEKLKLQLTRRFDFSSANLDTDVDNAIGNMARKAHRAKQQFVQELEKSGVQIGTLKSRIKAEIIWTQVIRGKYQASFQFNEHEVLVEMENRKKEDQGGFDYTLRPIIFSIPRGSPDTAFEARRREAEGLRIRFQDCEEGVKFARALRDVYVREPITRSSADLPPQLREILEKAEVGKLTPPERTMQAIELYALCAKKKSNADNTPARREVRDEHISKQFQINSKKFLKELRDQAYIQYK